MWLFWLSAFLLPLCSSYRLDLGRAAHLRGHNSRPGFLRASPSMNATASINAPSINAASINGTSPALNTTPTSQLIKREESAGMRGSPVVGSRAANLASMREHVSGPVAQMLLEDMVAGRALEDMCAQMYYRGKVAGFVHLYTGQEAVSTGVIKALRPDDYVVSTYRDHVHALSKGVPAREIFAELYGKETGCSKGRGGSMHMFSKPHGFVGGFAYIGEQIPIALGFAFSSAYRKNTPQQDQQQTTTEQKEKHDNVTVCFTGDGSTNMGQFYEAMNMAATAKLPIVFVVENNNWAIGMAHYRSTSVPEIYKKAEGFGIPGVEVDGMDVLAVRKAAREAIDRARAGGGPTLIEALTYRFRGHSLADPDELRAPVEKSAWAARDPLNIFGDYMKKMGYGTDESIRETKSKVRAVIDDAVQFADSSPEPPLQDIGKYIFGKHFVHGDEPVSEAQLKNYQVCLEAELAQAEKKKAGDRTPPPPIYENVSPPIVID